MARGKEPGDINEETACGNIRAPPSQLGNLQFRLLLSCSTVQDRRFPSCSQWHHGHSVFFSASDNKCATVDMIKKHIAVFPEWDGNSVNSGNPVNHSGMNWGHM